MRQRSITGPLILVLIGVAFLLNNVRPDLFSYARMAEYWPFLLIAAGVIGLIEVLFHASRGSAPPPRPLGGGWIIWLVVLCLLYAMAGGARRAFYYRGLDSGRVSILGSDYEYDVNASGSTDGVTRIVLDNLHGNVSLSGEDGGGVKVSGRKTVRAMSRAAADRANQQSGVHVERQGDLLVIRSEEPAASGSFQVTTDLDITIPRAVSVEARGRNGDLTIDDVNGSVEVSNGRGDVRLNHVGKDVRVETSRSGLIRASAVQGNVDLEGRGGDVQLENVGGQVTLNGEYSGTLEFRGIAKPVRFQSARTDFRVESIPGTVTLDLGDLKMTNVAGPVRFHSNMRDIEATDVSDALDLNVDRGDVQIAETKLPLPKMDIHTRNGDITVTVPGSSNFELVGTTSQGDVDNEFGGALQTHQDGRHASIRGQNGTGPQITLATDRGSILFKKN